MTRPDDAPEPADRDAPRPADPDAPGTARRADDLEAPDADAAEQSLPANPVEEPVQVRRNSEVGEWDAVEQSIVVDLDDEYDH